MRDRSRLREEKMVGYPLPPLQFSHHSWRIFGYKTLGVPQDLTPSFESVLCEPMSVDEKKWRKEDLWVAC